MNRKGFTLVELLVVVAMLGVLSTFVIIQFSGAQRHARDTKRREDAIGYQTALEVYANSHSNRYPVSTTLANITSICSTLGISNCPADPTQTGNNNYKYRSNASGSSYVLYVTTEDPAERWVVCSNGNKGSMPVSWTPTSFTCPI